MDSKESLLKFPCEFPVKIIGRNEENFSEIILQIACHHFPDISAQSLVLRKSKNENFIAATLTVNAQSQLQLDRFYSDLSRHEKVIMAL